MANPQFVDVAGLVWDRRSFGVSHLHHVTGPCGQRVWPAHVPPSALRCGTCIWLAGVRDEALFIGALLSYHSRLVDLVLRNCLSLLQLPAPAVVSACDALETLLFVGGGDGVVYQIDLHGAAAAKAAPATYAGEGTGSSGCLLPAPLLLPPN